MEDEIQADNLVVCCKNRAIVSTFQGGNWPQWSNLLGLFASIFALQPLKNKGFQNHFFFLQNKYRQGQCHALG